MGTKNSDHDTLKLLGRVMAYVALIVAIGVTVLAYVETLWMKAEIKREAKELRKLKEDVRKEMKDVANSRRDSS